MNYEVIDDKKFPQTIQISYINTVCVRSTIQETKIQHRTNISRIHHIDSLLFTYKFETCLTDRRNI